MQKGQKLIVGRFAGAETTEELARQKVFLARVASLSRFRCASCGSLVFQQPFEHIDGAGEGRANRTVGPLTVPAAIVKTLTDQPVDNGRDVDAEIGAVSNGSAVDALLDLALPVGLAGVVPPRVGADQFDGTFGPGR